MISNKKDANLYIYKYFELRIDSETLPIIHALASQ
jgi:hypothetical protein